MRRMCLLSFSMLFLVCLFVGCGRGNPKAENNDQPLVNIDPNIKFDPKKAIAKLNQDQPKVKGDVDDPPAKKAGDPPASVEDKQEKYETAIGEALLAMAERKWDAALISLETAKSFDDTEFVRNEIARVRERLDQDGATKNVVKNIEAVINDGKADEAAKLVNDALKEFGDGDNAARLVQLKLQADALQGVQNKEDDDARFKRFKAEGEAAIAEKNLRAAALALEQALQAKNDAGLQTTYDDIRDKLDRYDAARKKAKTLRKDPTQLDEALETLTAAAMDWDTVQIRADIDEVQLALAKRRDTVSVANFEVRNDVGLPDAGATIGDELLPRLKTKYDLVERGQVAKVVAELKLEKNFADDADAQQQIAKLAKVRYLVVGSVSRLAGVTVRAQLIDMRTGLVVQTAKVVGANIDEAMNQLPDLAKQLLMTDDEKALFDQEMQQNVAKKVAIVAENAVVPAAPLPPEPGAEMIAPPAMNLNPAPPAIEGIKVDVFKNFAAQPAEFIAPPAAPPEPMMRNRLVFAAVELGDDLVRAGRVRDALRQFEFALVLAPDNFDIRLRLERVRAVAPPAPVVIVMQQPVLFRPRIAVLPFVTVGNPFVVPPSLSGWTPNHLTPYFTHRYDVVDPAEVYWFMGRMGITMRDLMIDPDARRWLGRAVGVRYFVLGNHIETASFHVNAYLIDAEFGFLQGHGHIHVQNRIELRLRLPELAQLTMMTPAERAVYLAAKERQQFENFVRAGNRNMDLGRFRDAVGDFGSALRLRPQNVQVQFLLHQARDRARFQEWELARRQMIMQQQAAAEEARRRQLALAREADEARIRSITLVANRDQNQTRVHVQLRVDAQNQLLTQAKYALQTKNFGISVNLFQGALNLTPPAPPTTVIVPVQPAVVFQDFAQARVEAERRTRLRAAELAAVREETLRKERERQLLESQAKLEAERQAAAEKLAAVRAAQKARDDQGFTDSIAQGVQLQTQNKYEAALTAYQGALRFAYTMKQREQVNLYVEILSQRQAEALAKSETERKEIERKLSVERERRKAAEAIAKQNEEKYLAALALAQKALATREYDLAESQFEEARKVRTTDIVLTGLRQVQKGRTAQLAELKQAAETQKKAETIKQWIDSGNTALDAKQFTEAVKAFQQARKLAPDSIEVVTGLTRAEQARDRVLADAQTKATGLERFQKLGKLLKSGQANIAAKQFEAAVANLTEAASLDPVNPAIATDLKRAIAGRDGQFADAKAQAAAKERAVAYQKWLGEGRSAMASKRYPEAIKAFTEAQKVLPGDKTSKDYLLDAQTAKQAAEDAVVTAAKARAEELRKVGALQKSLALGRGLLTKNDLTGAAKALNQAKAIDPANAEVQRAQRDLDQAVQRANSEAALQKKRDQQFQALLADGKAALTGNRYAEAIKALSGATTLVPSSKEAQDLFRRAQLEQRAAEEASLKVKLQDIVITGYAALKAKNFDAAEKAFRSASLVDPTNPQVVQGLKDVAAGRQVITDEKNRIANFNAAYIAGNKALQAKNYEGAIQSFQQALKIAPNEPNTMKLLQQTQQELNSAGKAQVAFKQAMDAGDKAMTLKSFGVAIKMYTEATTLNPTDALARQRLQQAQQALADANQQAALAEQKRKDEYAGYLKLGDAAMAGKRFDEAINAYQGALKIYTKDPIAVRGWQDATKALNASKTKTLPPPVEPKQLTFEQVMQKAAGLEKEQKYADAMKAYQDALKLRAKDADALAGMKKNQFANHVVTGQQYQSNGMFIEAVREFEAASRLQPNNVAVQKLLKQAQSKK
ncbi:MAG: tetratricopeptide repeat protein [Gemmataceae bacterium]|nr:tetratricopeptide repeat protein [Gemmataceae bacterium]